MKRIVVKFGGTSLADGKQFQKVKKIIEDDPARCYVVASAPGKRFADDIKVTDLLLKAYRKATTGGNYNPRLEEIKNRFQDIMDEIGVEINLLEEIELIREHLDTKPDRSYMGSRGEYLNSKIMAAFLGYEFVDPAECIVFNEDGSLNAPKTRMKLAQRLASVDRAVIAGFYGAKEDGSIQTFSRGGSDITGSLVAEAVEADLYENWTDVSGFLAADPRIVNNPRGVEYITYRELRILSYMGASVLHRDAVYPVSRANIPINIRNTNRPEDKGTMIIGQLPEGYKTSEITGIAGFKGVSVIQVEKIKVSDEAGFTAVILDVFKRLGIPFEQCITGIDTVSVVIRSNYLETDRNQILYAIHQELDPDDIYVKENLAMIAVVGESVGNAYGATVELLHAVKEAGIELSTINQGAGNFNLLIGVDEEDYEKTINVLHDAMVGKY